VSELHKLLSPRSVAIIGASSDPTALSGRPLGILLAAGFGGQVTPVNPRHAEVGGLRAYPNIGDVPGPVDAALILVPKAHVIGVLQQCAAAGVGLAVVFTSGFAEEEGEAGAALEDQVRQIAAASTMRIIGPNAEGFLNTGARVAATFSPAVEGNIDDTAAGGTDNVAVISHSGGLGFALFDRGRAAGIGFDYIVSTGNEADLDVTDLIEHLLAEGKVRVFLLVAEGFRDPDRFMAVADQVRRAGKSIVVAKLGSSFTGASAALAHTAHRAGSPLAYQAAFTSRGVAQARDEDELLDMGMLLSRAVPAAGNRVGIITTSGGAGVWLADACASSGLAVPELSPAVQHELRALIPSYGSPRNPVDMTADAIHGSGLSEALACLLSSGEVDVAVLIMSMANPTALARQGPDLQHALTVSTRPVILYSYTRPAAANIRRMADLRLAWFPTPTRTARALAWLAGRRPHQAAVPVRWADGDERARREVAQLFAEMGLPQPGPGRAGHSAEMTVRLSADEDFGTVIAVSPGPDDDTGERAALWPAAGQQALDVLDSLLPPPARAVLAKAPDGRRLLADLIFLAAGTVGRDGSPVRELALRLGLDPDRDDPVRVLDAAVVRTGHQTSAASGVVTPYAALQDPGNG
jgi:acyl-CoA synthetase (NDP forming)